MRHENDHPGGQERIHTSNLILVFTHLSQPGHRRGCFCIFPRCILRQFVAWCLHSWGLFVEKKVVCFARFLSKWQETALWTWFRLVESDGERNDDGDGLGEEISDGGAWWKNDHVARRIAVSGYVNVPSHSERPSLSRDAGTNIRASPRMKHCQSAVRRASKRERWVKIINSW